MVKNEQEMLKEQELLVKVPSKPMTLLEFRVLHDAWIRVFKRGANGHQESYNLARDTRHIFEKAKFISVDSVTAELQDIRKKYKDELNWNIKQNRNDEPKSERRKSVLFVRIELYSNFIKQIDEVLARLGVAEERGETEQ